MKNFGETSFMRHSVKPEGEDVQSEAYQGISEGGVRLARERADEIMAMVEQAEENDAVFFVGGNSEVIRTKSTVRALGDELNEIASRVNKDDIVVVQPDKLSQEVGQKKIAETIKLIEDNPQKKVIVSSPLFLKEFGLQKFTDEKGNFSEYVVRFLKKTNNNQAQAVKMWFDSEGKVDELSGPTAQETAEEHVKGIERLHGFLKKLIKDRPVKISFVGHSWSLDALATYLANGGKVDSEGFERIGGKVIKETQLGQIKLSEDNSTLLYDGKEYEIKIEDGK